MKKKLLALLIAAFLTKSAQAEIFISEVMPNPKGSDKDKEWVEIHNPGPNSLNLKGWIITSDNHQKEFNKDKFLQGGQYATINLPLKNSNNTVKLLSPTGKINSSVSYLKSKQGLSLSLINQQYLWTISTQAKENPQITKHKGIINQILTSYFTLLSSNSQKHIPIKNSINQQLLKLILKPGRKVELTLEEGQNHSVIRELKLLQ